MDDFELLEKIKHGDKQAFEQLFKTYYRQLILFAAKYLRNIEEAEEIVQNIFVSFWEKADAADINISLKSYLYRWTANACLNKIKHEKIKDKYARFAADQLANNLNSGYETSEPDIAENIRKAVDKLPERCKMIFIKSRFEGKRNAQIAIEMDISEKTVENQMTIAIKKIKDELKEYIHN